MENSGEHADKPLSLSKMVRIDEVCDRFDRAIQEAIQNSGAWPSVEDYLGNTTEPVRSKLRKELLAVEASCRQQQAKGKYPDPRSESSPETRLSMSIFTEQFVERLTQSGLLSAREIDAFQQQLPPDQQPKDVQQFAQALVEQGRLTKYQAQAVCDGKIKGLVFGEYTVLDEIGEGGMGVVYKAQHRRMKRLVAVKRA